jgi:uncharacterized protein
VELAAAARHRRRHVRGPHRARALQRLRGSAVATDGQRFFYVNPLQRREDHYEKDDPGRRRIWFNCACCPPNIMRLIAPLEHYLATGAGDTLFVHQYTGSRLAGAGLDLEGSTDYPWSGAVYLRVLAAPQAAAGLALRVPAWSAHTRIAVNNDPERTGLAPGYHVLRRSWRAGDLVTLHLDMTPRRTCPDRRVDAVRGCVAIERGPLVIEVTAPAARETTAIAIPYFQWDNRDGRPMRVWMPC